jgi:hypothetical protein
VYSRVSGSSCWRWPCPCRRLNTAALPAQGAQSRPSVLLCECWERLIHSERNNVTNQKEMGSAAQRMHLLLVRSCHSGGANRTRNPPRPDTTVPPSAAGQSPHGSHMYPSMCLSYCQYLKCISLCRTHHGSSSGTPPMFRLSVRCTPMIFGASTWWVYDGALFQLQSLAQVTDSIGFSQASNLSPFQQERHGWTIPGGHWRH